MQATHDDLLEAADHKVVRNLGVITITPKVGTPLQRKYKTEHAACCAMGRCRSDPGFISTLVKSIMVEQLKGPKRTKTPDNRLKLEHLLMAALRQRAEEKDQTHPQIIAAWLKQATAARKKGLDAKGINEVREALHRHNQTQAAKEG